MNGGFVSVIMPAYDEEAFIAEALESVQAQTYQPREIIVVDDGSGDRTAEIAAAHNVHLLRQTHQGPAAARNAGLSVARGDYWMIFDADDVMPPDRLACQVAHLEQHPELDIVFGLTEAFVTPGEPRPSHFATAWEHRSFPWHATTMLARRTALDRVGPFDETLIMGEDIDWLTRAEEADVSIGHADHVALRYRIHSANMTSDVREKQHAMLTVLRRSVWRRRQLRTKTDDDE